jgi:hypothetical protein
VIPFIGLVVADPFGLRIPQRLVRFLAVICFGAPLPARNFGLAARLRIVPSDNFRGRLEAVLPRLRKSVQGADELPMRRQLVAAQPLAFLGTIERQAVGLDCGLPGFPGFRQGELLLYFSDRLVEHLQE